MAWSVVFCVASGCSPYAEFVSLSPRLEAVDVNAAGVGVGIQGGEKHVGFIEVRATRDSSNELDLLEILSGGRFLVIEARRLKIGVQLDAGLANASLERFRNDNSLVSFGTGAFAEVSLAKSVSAFALGGLRQYWDTTKPTTCNDGWQSGSTGQGTCSHHGGIHHYNDMVGDGAGFEIAFGLRWRF